MNKQHAILQTALELELTPAKNGRHPEDSIPDLKGKVAAARVNVSEYDSKYGSRSKRGTSFLDRRHELPEYCFRSFSKEDKLRIKFGSIITMHPTFVDALQMTNEFEVVNKIANSMWRYGYGQDWNTLVRAYNGLKRFDFGEGFEARIDMSTGCNTHGFTRYEGAYIDGTFGFLIYYKGKHVLTIGFSFADRKRLLIQQVQLKSKKGNRFLYKLPEHHLDYAIGKMREAFPDMGLYLCVADDQVKRIVQSYVHNIEDGDKFLKHDAVRLKRFYGKRLKKFNRRPSKTEFHGVRFRKLVDK
jgi:hypothetical protein